MNVSKKHNYIYFYIILYFYIELYKNSISNATEIVIRTYRMLYWKFRLRCQDPEDTRYQKLSDSIFPGTGLFIFLVKPFSEQKF